ncbi:NPL4-domain-containing protein [Linderina pennispora]|uniref:Nuclear protein localization protein 4 n=1 Tax=Linderina pennispora TaxID=61395 RepID=A0A1Y1W382_9FUNG|nr:NPL4-domain-containing protein [Linderina pennispora]ORX67614.1 NPL4-domain-containing protein [Linderina pennispora]
MAEFELTMPQLGLKHGDMLYARIAASARPSAEPSAQEPADTASVFFQQDEVDSQLEKDDGKIKRKRDGNFCKHGDKGMCEYCWPLEPFDDGYLAQHKIKHMSFHAYLRKTLVDQKDPDFGVKADCKSGHAPWPEGICTKCQPSAITLMRQRFRMVDHVEFAHQELVERLLAFWRATRCQRFGYLFGHYERYTEVPLGVKAVVEAAWDVDGIKLPLESEEHTQEMERAAEAATACGLQIVGMVFTDLEPADEAGKVLFRRHGNSYFLTSLDRCRWARGGHFGSKFVTVCISGNQDQDVEMTAWQVSSQAMAMQKADLVVPSSVPSKLCVLEATKTRYVPDIFYKYTNEYNLPVTANAKPAFPIEYLLVNLTYGFPKQPMAKFRRPEPFPIENREHMHEVQTPAPLRSRIQEAVADPAKIAAVLSDFHLLVYLVSLDIFSKDELKTLGRNCNRPRHLQMASGWQTLSMMLEAAEAAGPAPSTSASAPPPATSGGTWACRHCTFENTSANDSCEMCALPRD